VARESTQKKLERVRPPRVQISYDVEIGDAIQLKELPFVLGVMADLSGMPDAKVFKERRFAEINPDNFDDVLRDMKPHLQIAVENKLSDDPEAGQLKVDLKFEKLADFEPGNVAKQVKPLKELLDLRTKLADLRGTLQTNDKLDTLLLEAVSNTEKLQKLGDELGIEKPKTEEPNA
jgi:type VI secretion system protein ImpB